MGCEGSQDRSDNRVLNNLTDLQHTLLSAPIQYALGMMVATKIAAEQRKLVSSGETLRVLPRISRSTFAVLIGPVRVLNPLIRPLTANLPLTCFSWLPPSLMRPPYYPTCLSLTEEMVVLTGVAPSPTPVFALHQSLLSWQRLCLVLFSRCSPRGRVG